jgi:hypothetical protein
METDVKIAKHHHRRRVLCLEINRTHHYTKCFDDTLVGTVIAYTPLYLVKHVNAGGKTLT